MNYQRRRTNSSNLQYIRQYPANSDDFCLPRLLISNVRSLHLKIDELEMVYKDNEADLVCITESWLHSGIPDSGVSPSNYLIFRNDRLTTIDGGVCIYVNSKIPSQRLIKYEDQGIESLWLSIRPFRLPRSISLILLAVTLHRVALLRTKHYTTISKQMLTHFFVIIQVV